MYARSLRPPPTQSFFLFGPRGVGKTAWLRQQFPNALFFDLLKQDVYAELVAAPQRLDDRIPPGHGDLVVIDEAQRVPEILNEVHRLIESRRLRFALTGSSARKVRGRGVALLAGRAFTRYMHPLTAQELGAVFDVARAVRFGGMPLAWAGDSPQEYLAGYTGRYLREEVQQEGITRNVGAFARFVEAASFSLGAVLNMASVARECAVSAKVAEGWFTVLEDLLIAVRLPVFAKRAKRRMTAHPKFYYFDAGVFQAIRPRGPLDTPEQIRAANDYLGLGYRIHYWRTAARDEVDFVLYGERGLRAFEVTRSSTVREEDLHSSLRFLEDYPEAKVHLVYPGNRRWHHGGVEVLPLSACLRELDRWLCLHPPRRADDAAPPPRAPAGLRVHPALRAPRELGPNGADRQVPRAARHPPGAAGPSRGLGGAAPAADRQGREALPASSCACP